MALESRAGCTEAAPRSRLPCASGRTDSQALTKSGIEAERELRCRLNCFSALLASLGLIIIGLAAPVVRKWQQEQGGDGTVTRGILRRDG